MATNRNFQCPYCNKKFDRIKLCSHLEKVHQDELPESFTPLQMTFHIVNKKPVTYRRPCRICKADTEWDENKGRYNFLCGKKSCHDAWVEKMKKDMGDKMGSNRPTSTPEGLQKMLASRKISGTYKFQDGGIKTYTGSYEKKALEFLDKIMNIKSEDIMCPGPILQYSLLSPNVPNIVSADDKTDYNEYHTYIPDMYYIPYNLLIEVKDGGNRPNMNTKLSDTRKRQMAKEKHIIENTDYNYLRLTDNDFSQLLSVFADLKLHLIENDTDRVIHVNEDVTTIGAFPSQSVMQSGPVIVNYLQNNVFAKPEIAIADSPKLQRMIIKNKFNELEEVDSSLLFNAKYSVYSVNLSESTLSKIKENIGKQVSEDFLYETIFGHKCFSDDQILFEESAISCKDFYETLQEDENMINTFLSEATFEVDNEVPEEIVEFNKELNSYDYGILINGKVVTKNPDWTKYKTVTIAEFEKYHCGVCWDFVNYEANWFKKHGYNFNTYYIQLDNNNDCPSHTFLIFHIKGKSYYFESSWFKMQGIRKFNSDKEAFDFICKKHNESFNKDGKFKLYGWKYNTSGLDNHLTSKEYMDRIYETGTGMKVKGE